MVINVARTPPFHRILWKSDEPSFQNPANKQTSDNDNRRPCSDSRHVTAPYKLALYYYLFY